MVRKDIQQLLQECLDGYDAGLTPEECLSAYPRLRRELEPLFRQAISLRVAYAAAPRQEFRLHAREKLMFAAGRDVTTALAARPSTEFVATTRLRLLNTAGARAQEALRDVPPPRLPFWANARRHLLETAATTPPKPAHRLPTGLRYALSAAVIVLAMAIAGAGFFLQNSPANHTAEVSAELENISQGVATAEQLQASGQSVSSLLDHLSTQTSQLAAQYSPDDSNSQLLQQLPDLIQRQQKLIAEEGTQNDTLASAQQRLTDAGQKVAALSPTETPATSNTPITSAALAPSPEPTTSPTAVPSATTEVTIPDSQPVDQSQLGPGQIVSQYDPTMTDLGLRWWLVTTSTLTFDMPQSWEVTNVQTDGSGLAVLDPPEFLFVSTDVSGITLVISNATGKVDTVINGVQYTLRDAGDASPMSPSNLYQLLNLDPGAASLYDMLHSIALAPAEATPTSTPSVTSTPTTSPSVTTIPATKTPTPQPTADASTTPSNP